MKKSLFVLISAIIIFVIFLSGCNSSANPTAVLENTPTTEVPAKTNLPECSSTFMTWFEVNDNGGFSLRVGNNNDPDNSLLNETVTYEIYNIDPIILSGELSGSGVGAEFTYNLPDGTTSGPWNDVHFTQVITSNQKDVSFTARIATSRCYKDQDITFTDLPVQ